MQTFLFYTRSVDKAYTAEDIAEVLQEQDGFEWDGHWQEGYRSGIWVDPLTSAACYIDVGTAQFDHDDALDEKKYDDWELNALFVKIPLAAPHWYCVESLRFIEELLKQLPGVAVLDTEDTGEVDDGPYALNRMRGLANWEQLHAAQTQGRDDCYRMSRVCSVALWRYRRAAHEYGCEWPQALVLLDKDVARSAVVWDEPEDFLIVPPVELAVLKTDTNTIVVSVEELISRAAHVNNLDCAGAVKIPIDEAFDQCIADCVKMDVSRFKFLTDDEWSD